MLSSKHFIHTSRISCRNIRFLLSAVDSVSSAFSRPETLISQSSASLTIMSRLGTLPFYGTLPPGHAEGCACFSVNLFLNVDLFIDHPAEDRFEDDLDIQPDAPVVNVPEVQFNPFFDAGVSAVAVYLGPAGNAGLHLVLHHVERNGFLELLDEIGELRPGADQAHIAFEDVDELGQLVQAQFSQETAELRPAVILVFAPGGIFLFVLFHAAEFQHFEFFSPVTDSCLFKKNRAGAGELHTDGDDQEQGAEENQAQGADQQVAGPSQDRPPQVLQAVHPHVDQLAVANHFYRRVGRDNVVVEGNHRVFYPVPLTGRDDLPEAVVFLRVQGNNHLTDIR